MKNELEATFPKIPGNWLSDMYQIRENVYLAVDVDGSAEIGTMEEVNGELYTYPTHQFEDAFRAVAWVESDAE